MLSTAASRIRITPTCFSRPTRALAAACVIGISLLTATVAEAREFVSIKGKTVNVREQPNTRSATRWELGSGYPLVVQQRKGQWIKVRDYEASLGWVHAPLTSKAPHRVVTARVANLRATPSGSARVVGKLQRHEIVQTLKNSGTWAQVRTESGATGWIATNLTWGW